MKVAISILPKVNDNLALEIKKIDQSEVDFIHLDVMDGKFVNNKTFDYNLIKDIRNLSNKIFDTHLMIENPEKEIINYIKAGSDYITFHFEATKDINNIINLIKSHNKKCGISIKPNTKVEMITPYLKDLDLVLVMSVEPGFGGQKFMDNSLEKIEILSKLKKEHNYQYLIEVDGGINDETSQLVKKAGCDIVVSGSYLFKGNLQELINSIR